MRYSGMLMYVGIVVGVVEVSHRFCFCFFVFCELCFLHTRQWTVFSLRLNGSLCFGSARLFAYKLCQRCWCKIGIVTSLLIRI